MKFTDKVLGKVFSDKQLKNWCNRRLLWGLYDKLDYRTQTDLNVRSLQRSISNWISNQVITDIGYYFNTDQTLSSPWDNVEKMWFHSPLKYANQAVTPTLFIHSEEDYRCWFAEGLQMFTALKYHGVDARLCMFREENHELSRSGKPRHRVRRLKEITNWFENI